MHIFINTDNYVVKTCSQKFDLPVRYITLLNAIAHVCLCACDSMPFLKVSGPALVHLTWNDPIVVAYIHTYNLVIFKFFFTTVFLVPK